ncbi:MAG: hypothetical protein FJZ87_11015 [Chloroflexi bacterium]|nr:hypothetical protein [Chloroflexota bacterium]
MVGGLPSAVAYAYDVANRLSTVNGTNYSFDATGNASASSARRLLNDGTSTYTYDSAREASRRGNRLISVLGPQSSVQYSYNGLGDRLTKNGIQYTLDLNPSASLRAGSGLTQVLDDGTNAYTYGVGRVSQKHGSVTEYFLSDALGYVRQLTDSSSVVTLAKSYAPYGKVTCPLRHSVTPSRAYPQGTPKSDD